MNRSRLGASLPVKINPYSPQADGLVLTVPAWAAAGPNFADPVNGLQIIQPWASNARPFPSAHSEGRALTFDGVDDYLEIADCPTVRKPTTEITLVAWVRFNASKEGYGAIIHKNFRTGSPWVSYAIGHGSDGGGYRINFQLSNADASGFQSTSSGYYIDNSVSYAPFVFVARWGGLLGTTMRLDVFDGATGGLLATSTGTKSDGSISYGYLTYYGPLRIGQNESTNNLGMHLFEARVYKKCLPWAVVQEIANPKTRLDLYQPLPFKVFVPTLSVTVDLVVEDAAQAHLADALTLGQAHTLALAEATHNHASNALVLTQEHTLAVEAATHVLSDDMLTLTQAHLLEAQGADHAHAADTFTLAQVNALSVLGASHVHLADALTLVQTHQVDVSSTDHTHTVDSLVLAQIHALSASDAMHAHTADGVRLLLMRWPAVGRGGPVGGSAAFRGVIR